MQPFEGLRVLDLTHVFAGPFCTFQLAVMGAEVIKIEPPHIPDMMRHDGGVAALNAALQGTYYLSHAAGKKSITLDLRSDAGREVFHQLVKTADVLVQNYAGPALDDLGMSYAAVSAINPQIIYCSMSGFGQTGPKAGHPAYDNVIQAWSGLMATNGWSAEDPPLRIGPPMVDYGTGAQAAFAISAALFQRTHTGKGQFIDVAMADAALMLMTAYVVDTLATGNAPARAGNRNPKIAGYGAYQASDGWVMFGAWTNVQMEKMLRVLGLEAEADVVSATPRAGIEALSKDLFEVIEHAVKHETAQHWEDVMNAAHVPAARVRDLEESLREAQVAARGVLAPYGVDRAEGMPEKIPMAAFTFAHGGPSLRGVPPTFGCDTDAVLGALGYNAAALQGLRDQGVIA